MQTITGLRPQQYAIYKGITGKWGALQVNLQPAHFACKNQGCKGRNFKDSAPNCSCTTPEMVEREGCIFLEAASPLQGGNAYDWSKKVTLALNMTDLGKLLYFLRTGKAPGGGEQLSIIHDRFAGTDRAGQVLKTLRLHSPKGLSAGCMISVTEKSEGEEKEHKIPVSGDEVAVLGTLVQAAISRIVGWLS